MQDRNQTAPGAQAVLAAKPGVVLATPDEPLGRCIDRMAAADVGSIVVVEGKGRVVGILTERDVLRRWRELTQKTFMMRAIGEVATKPVFCMRVDEIGAAPVEMVRRRIRHIPLVTDEQTLIGIMSMRDVLAAQIKSNTLPRLVPERRPSDGAAVKGTLHLLTPTAQLTEICRRFVPDGWKTQVWTSIRSIENLPELADPAAVRRTGVVLDLDGVARQDWKALVRRFIAMLRSEAQPALFLVWTPALFPEKDIESLWTVARKAKWHAYQRPLPVSALGRDLAGLEDDLEPAADKVP